jgi:alpha-1,3-rhamnosyl/mannosyltransferase
MKVILDARWIFPEISGIGLYTQALISQLVALDSENEYVLLFDRPEVQERVRLDTGFGGAANFTGQLIPYDPLGPRNQLWGPGVLQGLRADVYHSPNYLIPLAAFPPARRRLRCVVTLHDVIPLVFPDHAPRSRKRRWFLLYKALMSQVGRTADAIITVSQSSRRDVIHYLRLPPRQQGKVRVVYNGVAKRFQPVPRSSPHLNHGAPPKSSSAALGTPPPSPQLPHAPRPSVSDRVILFVGRMDPYKNLVVLIEAFARLRDQGMRGIRLRIVGPRDPRYPEAEARAEGLGLARLIDWAGYVDGDRLVSEYQHADLFVLPSRYEGFGLPVLEAMACGVPVICSNTSSLPEVAGNAAIQVAPDDAAGLACAIRAVLEDPERAAGMREKGLRQAASFSWRQSAAETLQTYRDVAGIP